MSFCRKEVNCQICKKMFFYQGKKEEKIAKFFRTKEKTPDF